MSTYQLSLPLLSEHSADEDGSKLLNEAKTQLGFIPNLYAMMANFPGLLETYRFGDMQFRQSSGFSAIEQEVIYLTISITNECHYCVAAHSTIATHQSHVPPSVIDAIRKGETAPDNKLQALTRFTRAIVIQRGMINNDEAQLFLEAGFTEKHILAVILAVGMKTLSNYTNHLANTPIVPAFEGQQWHP